MKLFILLCITTSVISFQCGIHLPKPDSHNSTRTARSIIGGKLVNSTGKWPWHLMLDSNWNQCGGTLISPQWVLTAAHCVSKRNASDQLVHKAATVLPRVQIMVDTNGTAPVKWIAEAKNYSGFEDVYLPLAEIHIHPEYNLSAIMDDIALLKLEEPLTFNHEVSPICLPSPSQFIPVDGQAVATGIGKINVAGTNNLTQPDGKLREVIVPIRSREECEKTWAGDEYVLRRKVICANSLNHGTHQGDSGGPLMMKASDGRWFQLGITSFMDVKEIGIEGKINAFTDIRQYCDWIKETTGGEASCQEKEVNLEDVQIKT